MKKIIISEKKLCNLIRKVLKQSTIYKTKLEEQYTLAPEEELNKHSTKISINPCEMIYIKYGKQRNIDDYMLVYNIASEIESWWNDEDSMDYEADLQRSHRREDFFSKHQHWADDKDAKAAEDYDKQILEPYRQRMKAKLAGGKDSCYYISINNWFSCILEQMKDFFQNDCEFDHYQFNSTLTRKFSVQPEID